MTANNKTTGYIDKVLGTSKETVGKLTSTRLQEEGAAQKQKGQAEVNAAKAQKRAEATGDKISGVAKQGAGAITGDASLKNEGRLERLDGKQKAARNEF